ncbi:MAG TPA: hypothetical protein VIM65_15290 [Cyclobacteriaceae bacterium]
MTEKQTEELRDKILKGSQLAFQRLVDRIKLENGTLVFSKNGKIFHIKAKDLK